MEQVTGMRQANLHNDLEHPAVTENESIVKKRRQHVKMICMPKMYEATQTLNLLSPQNI